MSIADNIKSVRERIERAAQESGRSSEDITLVAVTKTVDLPVVREAYECGLREFGENRPQELRRKAESLADLDGVRWHMIGNLQRNKVKTVLPLSALIHSVDSVKLAEEIEKRCAGSDSQILLEVNVSGEETKSGLTEGEVVAACERVHEMEHVKVRGLMTMAPFTAEPEETRPVFAKLRRLADEIRIQEIPGIEMIHLSMGMSNDFEVAIEEGATIVRIGTALWRVS